ncbi:single-stranded DNA-binding protein [Microbacterium sp. P01]|uniref:single-stranded DNA-binding protein n=1 Tax=unclassified Microbacterium TaxID=2609290 RepID=UPI00366EBA62
MSDTITVTGNIATDPELKHTPAGIPIVTFRVASSQRRFDKSTSSWVEGSTNWYSVSAFRGLADHAHRSLRKGNRVVLTGRLKIREWDTGAKKGTTAEIEVDAIGHDLLWGTTVFQRDGESRSDHGDASDSQGRDDQTDSTGWSTRAPGDAPTSAADGSWSVPFESDSASERSEESIGAGAPF